jgi:hypothetical protein
MLSQLKDFLLYLFALALLFMTSCGPKIKSFRVEPLVIFAADSVRATWDVSGDPVLMVNDRFGGKDTLYRIFTLSVRRNGKEVAKHIEVQVIPAGASDLIVFLTTLKNDSLIAAGTKNTARWGLQFAIGAVSNNSNRPIDIVHGGRIVHLQPGEQGSKSLSGAIVSGYWQLRSPLTPAETGDHSHLPDKLSISITVKPQ